MATTSHQSIARPYSRYSREAVVVLGQHIRINRIEQKLSVQELAERVGVSRDMMRRIEQGDLRCGIGLVFEAATVVGVALFEEDRNDLTSRITEQKDKLHLLPKAIHKHRSEVKDDF